MSAARQALLNLVNSARLVEPSVQATASRHFVEDFELVARHYRLHERGEYEDAKEATRGDLENATVCHAALAAEILAAGKDA